MKKFNIYIPKKGIFWTRTLILYFSITVLLAVLLFCRFVLKFPDKHTLFNYILLLIFILFVTGYLLRFLGMAKIKQLKGKLDGCIIFEENQITIGNQTFLLDDISKIEFDGVDWYGLSEHHRVTFENGLSNGVENTLTVYLSNGNKILTKFQIIYACEFLEIKNVILNYYLKGKLSYLQTVSCLCIDKQDDWDELKRMKI